MYFLYIFIVLAETNIQDGKYFIRNANEIKAEKKIDRKIDRKNEWVKN